MLSSRRRPITWSDVRVGLFVISGLTITVLALLFFTPGQRLGSTKNVRTLFASVGGLTTGASVVMSGVQIGTVTDISFVSPDIPPNQRYLDLLKQYKSKMNNLDVKNPLQAQEYERLKRQYAYAQSHLAHIRVLMAVRSPYIPYIKADSTATIRNQGLVGEKEVEISLGTPDAPPAPEVTGALEVHSQEPPDLNTLLSNASSATNSLEDIMAQIDASIKNNKGTLGKLVKDQALYDSLQRTLASSAQATRYTGELLQSIKQGKGTLGKVFTDPALYNSTNSLMQSIQNGKGTLGKLINNPEMYDSTSNVMHHMDAIMAKASQGKGTVHSLLADPSLYNNASQAMANLAKLADTVNQGKGSLGKLAQDETFYKNASQAMANLAQVSSEIQNGNGSLGMLIKDKTLYQNISELSGEMVKFIKDFRKNPRKYLTVQFSVIKIF